MPLICLFTAVESVEIISDKISRSASPSEDVSHPKSKDYSTKGAISIAIERPGPREGRIVCVGLRNIYGRHGVRPFHLEVSFAPTKRQLRWKIAIAGSCVNGERFSSRNSWVES